MSLWRCIPALALLWTLALASSQVLRAQSAVISEFMAANDGFLLDEDGESSDWIEVVNAGASSLNLGGWFLTDDAEYLSKWRIPAVVLAPGQNLLVFASGASRDDPASELHTNFKLATEGEYLALVRPDGITVEHQFWPVYPPQSINVSYGLEQATTATALIAEGAAARTLIPSSGSLGSTWTAVGFADGSWTAGSTGVGYDTGSDYDALIGTDVQAAMRSVNSSAYIRVPFTVADPSALDALTLSLKYDDGLAAFLNGTEVLRRNAPATLAWNSAATAEHGQPQTGTMSQNFDAAGTAYVLTAHGENFPPQVLTGGPAGSYLRLMPDNTGSLTNTVGFNRVYGGAASITADFDFRMPTEAGHTGCCGERADGFGFALLDTAVYGTSGAGPNVGGVVWERPVLPSAFAVGFDIFDGTGNENTVSLNWGGTEVAGTRVSAFQLNNGVFNRCRVVITQAAPDSFVTLTITPNILGTPGAPVTVFNNTRVRGMQPFDNRVAFGGRTGGAFTSVDIDNISVLYSPGTTEIAYEDFDLGDRLGLLRSGQNVLALQGLNRSAADADFLVLPRLEATDGGAPQPSSRLYFAEPTPGLPNGPGFDGLVADVTFSRLGGPFASSISLQLSVATEGAAIRYTLDGSEPSAASTLYSAPISITTTRTVKAKAFLAGYLPSRTATQVYLQVSSAVQTVTSNVPLVVIETLGRPVLDGTFTTVFAAVIDTFNGRSSMTGFAQYSGNAAIRIRGSSSTGFPKKQYNFEIRDELGEDLPVSLMGMPAESDWILYGPYTDKALMRDALSYDWSNQIGRYAPRTRYCEVYLNDDGGVLGSADYDGVYVLIEKIKRDPNRVDVDELLPTDSVSPEVTGGYILKKDRQEGDETSFTTSRGLSLIFVEPKTRELTAAHRNYISGYVNQFEAALYGANFTDPNVGYARYIDVDAFIDHHILVEAMKNIDGYRLSTFMFKDRGEKLAMGPIWDYNLCLGNANYLEGWLASGWYYPQLGAGDYPWYPRLFQDPNFTTRYADRWVAHRKAAFDAAAMMATINVHQAVLQESQARNFSRWPVLGTYVWPNWYIANTWQEELTWMRGWLEDRLEWIDGTFVRPPVFNQDGGRIQPGFQLSMVAPAGTVYYTLDGSDPRLPGGAVSPTAQQSGSSQTITLVSEAVTSEVRVLVPTNGTLGSTWTGVSFNDASWTRGTTGLGVGYERSTGYQALIDVDVGTAMYNINGSVYIRMRFNVADPAEIQFLSLRMMYDDGFVVHLNGTEVARSNAPATVAWNSDASAQHDDAQAVVFQPFNLPGAESLLRAGTNVLAIQGLNAGVGSSDLLIVPELMGSSSNGGTPIILTDTTFVRARSLLGNQWSGVQEEVFVLDAPLPLRLTEILYNPRVPPGGSGEFSTQDFEFVELENIGASTIRLAGVQFTEGIQFDFTHGAVQDLGPGEFVLVVENLAAFEWLYDTQGLLIAGQYDGNFDNGGENVVLRDGRGEVIHAFEYDDTWYPSTDGGGFSLAIRDATSPPATWGDPARWQPSGMLDGTPGSGEGGAPPGGRQRPGDSNQDGLVDISDAVSLLNRLFLSGQSPLPCEGSDTGDGGNGLLLDVNGDTAVDLSDAVAVLAFLFRSGAPPALGTGCVRIDGCPERCVQ
jgi:hypothetical protein